jgi:hypothetical protein
VSRSLIFHPLDVVMPGDVVRCRCGGYVGMPPPCSVLLDVLRVSATQAVGHPGAIAGHLFGAVEGLAVFRCDRCKDHFVFGLP